MKPIEASPYPVDRAERLAKTMGENSATAHALAEMKRLIAAGEDVGLFVFKSIIFVGPRRRR